MYIKFTIIHRLLVTLVITSLLLVTTSSVSATKHGASTVSTLDETNTLSFGQGAPPPLGPPAPWAPLHYLSIPLLLTPALIERVNKAVDDVNATNEQATTGVRAKVSWTLVKVSSPSIQDTQYTDSPNEHFVNIPYKLDYRVYDMEKHTSLGWIDIPGERHISQTINLQMFCNNWYTTQGRLKLLTYAEHPYMTDEQGTLEQVVNFFLLNFLSPYIDSKVRSRLSGIQSGYSINGVDLSIECDTIGRNIGMPTDPSDDDITWSYHPPMVSQIPTAFDTIYVTLSSVKRLQAHNQYGSVLYDVVEAPNLEMYTNHGHIYIQLPTLLEGQQVTLNGPTMVINRPANTESLVVIANVILWQAGIPRTDSSFIVFGSGVNFGKGTQRLVVQKYYWTQFDHETGAKPYKIHTGGYELTFQVNLLDDKFHQ